MSARDGGPAFPCEVQDWGAAEQGVDKTLLRSGMSLRDYFAAKAMTGFISAMPMLKEQPDVLQEYFDHLPKSCYQIADAMLKERAK